MICDLDGVVYLEGRQVPGAGRALHDLQGSGYHLLFVTNNSTRPGAAVAARIADITGYPARATQVVSSAEAAATLLTPEEPVLVVGGSGIREALQEAGVRQTTDHRRAAAVVVGLDLSITYARLRDATAAIRAGARFIASNTDATYPTPDGPAPGAGSIVAALVTATGVQPEVAGKPNEPIRALIRSRLAEGPVWVVGDRPETDLAMARAEGWKAVLVLSGVTRDPESLAVPADLVLRSLAELPAVLEAG